MTTKEAQLILASAAADYLAGCSDHLNCLDAGLKYQQAIRLLGSDWTKEMSISVTATIGETESTTCA